MSNTPNVLIPYVPEGTLDPAAGLNDALNVIDALLQPRVIAMDLTEPPATGEDGDMYIVASGASGDWAGKSNWLARYVLEGQFWQFYEPGVQVQSVVNDADGVLYVYDQTNSSPPEWVEVQGGGGSLTTPIVTRSGAAYSLDDLVNGSWHTFSNAGGIELTIEAESSEPVEDEAEFGIYCASAAGLEITPAVGVTVVPPKGGTLSLEQGDFVLIKRLAADSFKVMGECISEDSP